MVNLEETIIMPLVVSEQGTIRIKGSRATLTLGDVYSSIGYYFTHRQES